MTNYEILKEYEEHKEPIPSYEEWQKLQDKLAEHKEMCCCTNNEVLRLENYKLKELLKVIRGYLVNGCDVEDEIRICEEIDEVLK